MNKLSVSLGAVLVASTLTAPSAFAADLSVGAGVMGTVNPYRDGDNKILPAPIINYESDTFYFRGLGGGYYLWNDESNKLSLTAFYNPFGFKPDDHDDPQMKQLDKRRGTLMAGAAYSHSADWGILRTVLAADTLGYSDGVVWDNTYLYRYNVGDWTLTPGVGFTWSSENYNRYYFGVSGKESARSGLDAYQPGDGWSPYAELSANYRINDRWSAWGSSRYIRLSDEAKDSPMVDRSFTVVFGAGVNYRF